MPDRTHYDVLSVSPTAPLDEIKKRYRELARKYHPDVAQDKDLAARVFAQINEAYKILSDSDARATYDAELSLKARQKSDAAARAAAPARPAPAPARPVGNAAQESERLTVQAQAAFVRNKMVEARSLAEQALRYYRKNAAAYEVLGDICRVQGRVDDALTHYTMALQIDPRNTAVRQRMERMARAAPVAPAGGRGYIPREAPGAPRVHPNSRRAEGAPPPELRDDRRRLLVTLVGFIGYASVLALVLFSALFLSERHDSLLPLELFGGFFKTWNWTFVGVMATTGLVLGATMTVTGAIRRIEDELLFSSAGRGTPLGLFVLVLAAVNYYVGAALHLVVAMTQETLTPSLGRLYGIITGATLLLALASTSSGGFVSTLAFGGNIVFLGAVLGWFLGDFFRDD